MAKIIEKGGEERRGGKERGGKRGLHRSLVCTLDSSESAKLKHGGEPSAHKHAFCSVAVVFRFYGFSVFVFSAPPRGTETSTSSAICM